MKRIIALFLLISMLLCGCGDTPKATVPSTETTEEAGSIQPTDGTVSVDVEDDLGIYEPDSPVEEQTQGAVRLYPLEGKDHYAVRTMGDGVVLFSGTEETTLTCLQDDKEPIRVTLTDIYLGGDRDGWRIGELGIVYYDDIYNEMVVLDTELKELHRNPMPVDMGCEPVFSQDMKSAYYFDRQGRLRVLDVDSGIVRFLSDEKGHDPVITDIHFGDTVLECVVTEEEDTRYLLIHAETGQLLYSGTETVQIETFGEWYFANWFEGQAVSYIFGEREGERSCLIPQTMQSVCVPFLETKNVACYSSPEEGLVLELYDLTLGVRSSAVTVPGCVSSDMVMDSQRKMVWLLGTAQDGTQAIYGWVPQLSLTGDDTSCVTPHYTEEAPDTEGLSRIAEEAKALGDRFGIKIRVHQAALGDQPSEYSFEGEHLVSVYEQYLGQLEKQLSVYPETIFKKLGKSSGNGRLTVSLVRHIQGNGDMGALSNADGVQYWKGGNAYIALAMNEYFDETFHHELFHAIDTYVLAETKAFDFWNTLNPKGFQYDNDHVKNMYRDPQQYLTGDERAFIDTYSMSFAKEDRARIMEYAVMEEQEACFSSATMQKKLRTICRGIRDAFGLGSSSNAFLWERYLETPIA